MIKRILAAAAGLMVLAAPASALAQKVAYYDYTEVVRDSNAWKALEAELGTKAGEIEAKLKPVVEQVNQEGAALEQVTSGLDPKAIQEQHGERVQKYQNQVVALQASQQRANQEFAILRELAERKISTAIAENIDSVAKAKKVDVLQRQAGLSYYSSKYDATKDMLAAVNRSLPTLSVDALAAEVQAAGQRQAAAN